MGTPRSRSGMSGGETDLESDCSESVSVIDIASEATWQEDTSDGEWEEDGRAGGEGDDSSDEEHDGHPILRFRECQLVNTLLKKERNDVPKRKSKPPKFERIRTGASFDKKSNFHYTIETVHAFTTNSKPPPAQEVHACHSGRD